MARGDAAEGVYEKLKRIYDSQIERKVALENIMFEERAIYNVARMRESSAWEMLSGFSMAAILAFASQMTKNRYYIVPIAPLVMWAGYRFESCFGKSVCEIKNDAESMLKTNEGKIQTKLIGPPITLAELDERRANWKK